MVDVVLFHHARGLTPGVHTFAERLRAAGHQVTVPDLFEGATFDDVTDGVAHAERIGFETVIARGEAAAAAVSEQAVYAGFSLGALPAQKLAQTRPGARAALLYHGGDVPVATFGSWPAGVGLQVHVSEADEWVPLAEVRSFVDAVPGGELYTYPGPAHLFTDSSADEYDPAATELVLERSFRLLNMCTADA